MRKPLLLAALLVLAGGPGCLVAPQGNTPQGATLTGFLYSNFVSPVSIETSEPAHWAPLRRVKGEAKAHTVLGYVAWGDYGFSAAYEDAVRTSGADALVDYQCDVNVFHVLGIYGCARTTVSGLAVRDTAGGSDR